MKEVLLQVATLLNTVEGSENVGSFLATIDDSAELVISAATPPFAAHEQASEVILPRPSRPSIVLCKKRGFR